MASVTVFPAKLSGNAMVPPSKSESHRALLLAALGRDECRLTGFPPPLCDDTLAMISGITALGAKVRHQGNTLHITPATEQALPMAECHVHACAAALRMLIPAFLLRGQSVRFQMEPSLFRRPLDAFEPLVKELGASMIRTKGAPFCTVELSGQLPAGKYTIDGTRSSQFASGMLMALAHAGKPSRLTVTGPLVSRPYLDMTLRLMERFHLSYTEISAGVFELSPSLGRSPLEIAVSGDWSQGALLLCINALGGNVRIENLVQDESCTQGDARVVEILKRMKDGNAISIDCTDIPDLAPILALTCSQLRGTSMLTGVSRLRLKESDRLSATQELLGKLGVSVTVSTDSDTLCIHGPAALHGGFEADARNDHRLVMLLAAASTLCGDPITVHGAECIRKSWPGFLETWRHLGGKAE